MSDTHAAHLAAAYAQLAEEEAADRADLIAFIRELVAIIAACALFAGALLAILHTVPDQPFGLAFATACIAALCREGFRAFMAYSDDPPDRITP